jgi:hypothetical protein
MKLTIIPNDKHIGIDGLFFGNLDFSDCGIPANVHALQWYETEGEIEFNGRPKPQNELISELPAWANVCVNKWNEAKTAEEVEMATLQAEIANNQSRTSGTQTI